MIQRLLGLIGYEKRESFRDFLAGEGIQTTDSGIMLTGSQVLEATPILAGVRLIAETISMLPLHLYKRKQANGKRFKERALEHPLYEILRNEANSEQTAFEFWEMMIASAIIRGNAYAEIARTGNRVDALWWLRSDKMEVKRDKNTHELIYEYTLEDGTKAFFKKEQILHIRGFSDGGLVGINLMQKTREAVGLIAALAKYSAKFFGNSAEARGVLEYPGKLKKEEVTDLADTWQGAHGGLDRSHRVAILQGGLTWKQTGLSPEDSLLLEGRTFQVQEAARILRVPPSLLADLSRATFSNIEEQGLQLLMYTFGPWQTRIEQRIRKTLLTKVEKPFYFAQFLREAILQGDLKSQNEAFALARQWGWLSRDEIRDRKNMNPGPGKDNWLVPMNMTLMEADANGNVKIIDGEASTRAENLAKEIYGEHEEDPDNGEDS